MSQVITACVYVAAPTLLLNTATRGTMHVTPTHVSLLRTVRTSFALSHSFHVPNSPTCKLHALIPVVFTWSLLPTTAPQSEGYTHSPSLCNSSLSSILLLKNVLAFSSVFLQLHRLFLNPHRHFACRLLRVCP